MSSYASVMWIRWQDVFDEEQYAGPTYEPDMHHDGFPLVAQPGDLYKNAKYTLAEDGQPRYYLNVGKGKWVPIEAEELNEWVRNGKMKYPTPVPATSRASSTLSQTSGRSTVGQ